MMPLHYVRLLCSLDKATRRCAQVSFLKWSARTGACSNAMPQAIYRARTRCFGVCHIDLSSDCLLYTSDAADE